jgi:YjbE family integral membrane protein
MLDWFRILGSIVLIDLVLSGDNALIIGAVMASLHPRHRLIAILSGGGGAIALRIGLTLIVTWLLQFPLIKAVGGLLLLIIAVKLLVDRKKEQQEGAVYQKSGLVSALITILVADATSSVDNVLSVGALVNGNLPLLALGLLFSITALLMASAALSFVIAKLPWLVDVASLVLAWTAAQMLLEDVHVAQVLVYVPVSNVLIPAFLIVGMLGTCVWSRLRIAVIAS